MTTKAKMFPFRKRDRGIVSLNTNKIAHCVHQATSEVYQHEYLRMHFKVTPLINLKVCTHKLRREYLLTYLHYYSSSDNMIQSPIIKFIFWIKVEVFFVRANSLQEFDNIIGIQSTGLSSHSARQVCVANVCNTLKKIQVKY